MIEYVLDSGVYDNLFKFIKSNFTTFNKQSLLLLINEQLKFNTVEHQTIFQMIYEYASKCGWTLDCSLIFEQLLIEMVEIVDIQSECDIDTVLKMSSNYQKEILQLLITYWKIDSLNYEKYKELLLADNKYLYELMIMLKKGEDEHFQETYELYLETKTNYFLFLKNDISNIMLSLALKNNQKLAMELIVKCQMIDVNRIRVPTDKSFKTYENKNYLMKLLLEQGYNVQKFNHTWVNPELFKNSLDARIIEKDKNNIIIDYNCKYKSFRKRFDLNVCDESIFSSESILNTWGLRSNITHPVLSIIINLNAFKYQRYNLCHFWIFIVIYVIPFYILLSFVNEKHSWRFWCTYLWCIIGTCCLFIHETIQLMSDNDFHINISNIKYLRIFFKILSNLFKIFLVVMSVIILIVMPHNDTKSDDNVITLVSVLFIFLSIMEIMIDLPYPSITIYMLMFKNVAVTFWKFLGIFSLIIFAFAFTFCIVMKPGAVNIENKLDNETFVITKLELETIFTNTLMKFKNEETVTHNFENIFSSLLKTIQMLSGEFTIEPFNLENKLQMILSFCFVITSFILFNLIIGLGISDIQLVRVQSDFLFLENQIKNTMRISNVFIVWLNIR